jgi:histidinol-phosphate aminotransferase
MASHSPPHSRRSFLQISSGASAALALRFLSEPMLAHAAAPEHAPGAVLINSNENPLGPCSAARDAIVAVTPEGGRYLIERTRAFEKQFADSVGVTEEHVAIYPGSTPPLIFAVHAWCSPEASYVTADPGFEAGLFAGERAGARVIKVPLTKTYSHDVRAMLAAAPDAGLFYICNPNNPTGTLTSYADIKYLVDNQPKKSVVLMDEAYIHFSDAPSAIELVRAGKDLIVLHTFSKLYGMAGLRCGFAVARPDLLERLYDYGGSNFMPVTAVAAASASLKQPQLIAERKRANEQVRSATFQWLDRNGYLYIPSVSNCFLLDTRRPAKEVISAMAQQNVIIGRAWPSMPNHARITVGTADEMQRFQAALQKTVISRQ